VTCGNCKKLTDRKYGLWDVLSCSPECDKALDDALEGASANLALDPSTVLPPLYTVERLADKLRPDDRSINIERVYDFVRFLDAVGLIQYVGITKRFNEKGPGRKVYRIESDLGARLKPWLDRRLGGT
jgi:hypothetical protein